MAVFRNKQVKIKLLCERAENEEFLREDLASQGVPTQAINEAVHQKRLEPYRTPIDKLPWEENTKAVKILNTTNIGLADTHLVKTSTKEMNAGMQKKFDKYKTQKQAQKEQGETGKLSQQQPAQASSMTSIKKEKKKTEQKEQDKLIKEQNFRDHLFEMSKGMEALNKMPSNSEYGQEFQFNNHMQDLCDTVNFDHHLLKNDLKWFAEAYVKYKGTMRK